MLNILKINFSILIKILLNKYGNIMIINESGNK
jgi:hypothetical protein